MNITDKQANAIMSMESFLDIINGRTQFENYQDFQEYFDLLKKKCDKKSRLLKRIKEGKTSFQEINQRKEVKKKKFYNTFENLKQYGINYIERFIPTKAKLLEKLKEKSWNEELANEVFEKLKDLINEELMLENLINSYISRWKNIRYIKEKLYIKKFDRELVEKKIDRVKRKGSIFEENQDILEKKIRQLIKKHYSRRHILYSLSETKEDKELVENKINEIFEKENFDFENITYFINLYKKKGLEKRKIIERLIAKSFVYNEIKEVLE